MSGMSTTCRFSSTWLITLKKVFARDGINQKGNTNGFTMEPFNGHN